MHYQNSRYTLRISDIGLISISMNDQLLTDRGALHEFIDLSVLDQPNPDEQRRVHHHIQLYRKTKNIQTSKRTFSIAGELETSVGTSGGMLFETHITCHDRLVELELKRIFLQSYRLVGDDSICFLSPGGFACTYHLGKHKPFAAQLRSDTMLSWESAGEPREYYTHSIPTRLKGRGSQLWACIMNETNDAGFGIIMLNSEPRGQGELRITRPRPPAELKFDEIEFEFSRCGPRKKGATANATILFVPCQDVAEVERIYKNRRQ